MGDVALVAIGLFGILFLTVSIKPLPPRPKTAPGDGMALVVGIVGAIAACILVHITYGH